HMTEVVRHC
nr:Chain P, peptide from p53 tumor suppressor [Homo sapiens]6VQO_Q Chain Q, peptide from p53 tumor suppressor [Homo sapiens]6VR5_P Chain P, Cellular tumor antigen p53 peptide [Homo sapiens]6VR5_Q Chain Q, Cellular tumor antigen p53 peptide [Homo sapiens]6VRM_P Chain P, Cellular tumor antigen p53 peptide [Homo sapiens]6VRN_P Chain P, Cellular tumor antigen p53 peptide [Homo sapiens]6W51_C Chain C, Cellular tumor antigen p53 peptide [Homo sapiens]6W51_F Chain F, Cellular tumor antigen p53 pept